MGTERSERTMHPTYWNYRILVRSTPITDTGDYDEQWEVIEVYYDDQDRIVAWSDNASPLGDSLDSLAESLTSLLHLTQTTDIVPVLTMDDLPVSPADDIGSSSEVPHA